MTSIALPFGDFVEPIDFDPPEQIEPVTLEPINVTVTNEDPAPAELSVATGDADFAREPTPMDAAAAMDSVWRGFLLLMGLVVVVAIARDRLT